MTVGVAELYERDRELAQLEDATEAAGRGTGGVVVIEGAPGIGKTTLLRAVAAIAERAGMLALRGRGNELESEFAFGLIGQSLEPALRRASESERSRLLLGAARHAATAMGSNSVRLEYDEVACRARGGAAPAQASRSGA